MNVRKLILLLATGCLATAALAQTPAEFKEMTDSLKARIQRRTTVRNGVALSKVARRGKSLDFHFKSGLGEVPWRSADVAWLRKDIKASLPDKYQGYEVGEIYVGTADIATLVIPEAGNNGKPDCRTFRTRDPRGQVPFVEAVGGQRFEKGLTGRNIALWQSHGRYYEEKFDRWEWQRAPLFRTVEDMYTQSYVLPFLIPMLENAGAYVMTPRERDIQRREVVADNDPAFEDERTDGTRLQGAYQEKSSWSDAGTGFADRKKTYSSRLENPFRMGTARMARCDNRRSHRAVARWTPDIPERGEYAVYVSYKTLPGSTDKAHYTVRHLGGESEFYVNQRMGGGTWIYLGTFPFAEGEEGCVLLDNTLPDGAKGETVTADAVRFGGGIGKIARGRKDASPDTYTTSGLPCFAEGAYYWMQWAGADTTILNLHEDDYTSDYADRGAWVGWMSGGSRTNPDVEGEGIPIDLSFAFHSDAGVTPNDSIIGTLAIYTLKADGSEELPNGEPRLQSRMLCDFAQTEIVKAIRSSYEPKWSRRGLWDKSYSESRTTTVPALLLEALSHQNFADMKYGLDPSFRFTVSRAIYKGMLKFLSSRYGCEYAVQPLPVHGFSATFAAPAACGQKARLKLQWRDTEDLLEPTAKPAGYLLQVRKGDGAFDAGTVLSGYTTDGDLHGIEVDLEPGAVWSYRIIAFNAGGKSFPSEILSAGVPSSGEGGTVLVVNNFTRISAPTWFDTPDYAGFDDELDGGVPYLREINFIGEQYQFRRELPWKDDDNPGFGGSYTDQAAKPYAGNTFDYPALHGRSLLAAGHPFHSASAEAFRSGTADGADNFALDLICGKQVTTQIGSGAVEPKYQVFPEDLQAALRRFSARGGHLLVSGAHIGTDVWDRVYPVKADSLYTVQTQAFVEEVLGYRWITNYASRTAKVWPVLEVDGNGFHGETGRFGFAHEKNPYIYNVETPDGLVPAGERGRTVFRYADSNVSAAVCATMDGYKTFCMGFPIETIDDPKAADRLMKDVLTWFGKE